MRTLQAKDGIKRSRESENSSVSSGNYGMASPSVRGGLYRCSRTLGRPFIVHVGLGARTSSSGGAQEAAAHHARRATCGARRTTRGARSAPLVPRCALCAARAVRLQLMARAPLVPHGRKRDLLRPSNTYINPLPLRGNPSLHLLSIRSISHFPLLLLMPYLA